MAMQSKTARVWDFPTITTKDSATIQIYFLTWLKLTVASHHKLLDESRF
jgi:hypothetical protein